MKALEIGPGKHPVNKDWFIMDMVDRPFVDVVHDLRQLPLPLESNQFDLIYMSHILEHVPWFQTIEVLKELRRTMKYGGEIEVWVPDFAKIVQGYRKQKPQDGWTRFNPHGDPMLWVNGRIFTYGPGEENWHRAVFDEKYLRKCLREAGFRGTELLKKPRGISHGPINLGVVAVK